MEKHFRNEDGVELTATNEIQAAAYENEGYKSVSKAKSKVADTEFASEFNPSALEVSAQHDANTTTNATQGAQAQPTANSFDAEFSQELNMDQVQAQQDAKAQANKTARKTNK